MFPDNEVIKKMQLERTKIGYLVSFGLAPHFKKQLLDEVKVCSSFVISFDESLNKVSQNQQMDLVVRFWSREKNEVATRYFTSAFLTKATALDLLSAFLAAVDCLELNRLLQISMDGPNVNKKFLRDLEDHLANDLKIESKMINLGSCGLHTVHCAFKGSINTTGWSIIEFLRALYYFFKDHPARRGTFMRHTGSTVFPKKFCEIRWLENEDVAQKALEMIPHLKKYVSCLEEEKSKPITKGFRSIEEHLKDPLLGAKLCFFKTLAADVQPFLTEFQSNEPLSPCLYTSLRNLVLKEMERFVLPEKVSLSVKVLQKSENFKVSSKVDVGIGAKCEIGKNKDNVTMLQVNTFKQECKNALKCFVEKMLNKSPLWMEATKLITSLDPPIASSNLGVERFEKLVILLSNNNLISSQLAEKALNEFRSICSSEEMKNFKRVEKTDSGQKIRYRLDHFWIDLLKRKGLAESALETVVKKVLILSHGNAQVERGFSVNKECLMDNMKESSLVSVRTVHDTVQLYGEVGKVPITKSLILSCRNASDRYKEALREEKEKNKRDDEKRQAKRKNQILVRELQEKKLKLMDEAKKEADMLESKISSLSNF